jgi:hypothetical protein
MAGFQTRKIASGVSPVGLEAVTGARSFVNEYTTGAFIGRRNSTPCDQGHNGADRVMRITRERSEALRRRDIVLPYATAIILLGWYPWNLFLPQPLFRSRGVWSVAPG